jgi:hypothetical protein
MDEKIIQSIDRRFGSLCRAGYVSSMLLHTMDGYLLALLDQQLITRDEYKRAHHDLIKRVFPQ